MAQYSTDEQITEERNFEGTLKITNSQLQQYKDTDKEHIMVSHFGGENGEEEYA